MQRQPRLSKEAIIEIKYGGGYEGLCDRYGDYYLAGYRLGGDTGILMSASKHSKERIDKWAVKATVTVLFISASKTWEKDFRTFSQGRQVKLLGYDTIDSMTWKRASASGDDEQALLREALAWEAYNPGTDSDTLRADADAIMTRSENLLERVGAVLDRHGYRNGESLTFVQCEELVQEGIVVELLLEPMSRLRDVVRWRMETNVI